MSTPPLLMGPPEDDRDPPGSQARSDGSRARSRRPPPQLPTVEKILLALNVLPQLVIAGIITPAQCNSATGTLRTLLTALQGGSAPSAAQRPVPRDLRDALRQNPALLDFFTPWLSAEQLAELFREEDDGRAV